MSTATGRSAEEQVADYLRERSFEILARNWRNRCCEIDIVAQKGQRIHFVEVKFRKNAAHGSGLEYVTKSKAHQLEKAALNWITETTWEGDYQIDAAGVDGMSGRIDYVANAIAY